MMVKSPYLFVGYNQKFFKKEKKSRIEEKASGGSRRNSNYIDISVMGHGQHIFFLLWLIVKHLRANLVNLAF